MKNMTSTRIAGLLITVAVAASACSSGDTADTRDPVFNPTASTTTIQPAPTVTTAQPVPETTPAPPPAAAIELIAATIDELGIASVVPRGWTETPEGVFMGEDASLGFGSAPTWLAPDLTKLGFALLEQQQVAGRVWDWYAVEGGEIIELLAVTPIGNMTFLVGLEVPSDLADQYVDSVATPALEAFEVATSESTDGEIELANVVIDGRSVAYAAGGSGETTVVFEAGLGNGMETWQLVAPEVTENASIFAYDRPGYGGSDPADTPRDGDTMVAELRQLLVETGHEPPYILVGHSLGGTIMDLYARTHPDEVSGLVLVDSRHHEFTARCVAQLGEVECQIPTEEDFESVPLKEVDEWRGLLVTEQQLAQAPDLSQQLPLVVIVAGLHEESDSVAYTELWEATQRDYAALVPGSSLVVAEESDHGIPVQQPAVIIEAIAEILGAAA